MLEWPWERRPRCPEAQLLITQVELELAQSTGLLKDSDQLGHLMTGLNSVNGVEQIAAAVEARKQLSRQLSDQAARALAGELQDRCRMSVGDACTDQTASLAAASREQVQGLIESALERLRVIYSVQRERDWRLQRLRLLALWILLGQLFIIGAIEVMEPLNAMARVHPSSFNYVTLASWGAIGALVSLLHRSRDVSEPTLLRLEPIRQVSVLRGGFNTVWVAAFLGAMFALVFFGVFAGGLLTGDLFPSILPCGTAAETAPCTPENAQFQLLGKFYGFAEAEEAGKMGIWAFLAGFAERLVPDVLDNFASGAEEDKKGGPKVDPTDPS